MIRPFADVPTDDEAGRVRHTDREPLAAMMLDAYRGTVDDGGEGPSEALAEIDRLLGGGYGTFNAEASEVVRRSGVLVNATLVTEFEGVAMIAFSLTHPAWQRRGLARAGMRRAMDRLARAGWTSVDLAVTAENGPARGLYEALGFVVVER